MAFTPGYIVNEGTQYEFTVSNETISEAVLADDGITESDIAPYCYTALVDSRIKSVFIQSSKNVMAPGFDGWEAENIPYYFVRDTRNIDSNDDINKDDKVYERNFITWNGTIFPGTPQEKQGTFLVMDMVDIKRWYVDFNAGMFTTDTFASEITEGGVTSVFPGYNGSGYTYLSSTINEPVIHSDNNDPMQNPNEDIHVVNVLVINDELWIGQLNPSCHGEANTGVFQSTYNQYVDSYVQGYLDSASSSPPPIIYQRGSDSWAGISEIKEMGYPDLGSRSTVYKSYVESSDGVIMEINGNSGSTFDVRTDSGAHCKDLNTLLTWQSWCGLKFTYDNVMYKPIIEQGVIVGYTDDMSAESEYDDMTNVTGNNISPTPPTPGPTPVDPWDVDPETYGWSGGEVSGMVKYYLLTAGEMSQLQTAIASNANWTIDYLNCIVSCFVVPNSGIFFDAPIPTTVKFVLDNATQWDTGVSCARIQGTKNKSGGTIEIPRLTNTFYDFEPYSDYSVYIPFCGRIPIKGNLCLGREIKVTYYPDVPTCSLTAVVSCGGATIAIAKGSFGTMTPVTSNGSDRKTAAVIGDVAPIITGIGTGIVGVALGNPLIVGAGAAQALGGIMGGVKETVQSYAYSVGSTGDSSFFGAGNRCYYYANYPLIDEVVNNSMFGHSVGYLCNSVGKLSSFKGFTMCANPHVTFSATSEEKEEIERLLSMGVIL